MKNLISEHSIKKIEENRYVSFVFYMVLNILLLPFFLVFSIIRIFCDIRFVKLYDMRIGHLAANTDLFLRRLKAGLEPKNAVFIGLASDRPANQSLFDMFKREMRIIQLPTWLFTNFVFSSLSSPRSILHITNIYQSLLFETNEYFEFNNVSKNLSFTQSEERRGLKLLKEMGVPKDRWFVCFHDRDDTYDLKLKSSDRSRNEFRNCSIENYLKAAEYIAASGGYALRMGKDVKKKLHSVKNDRIIDYATRHRTDFGDVYLPAKCKFFIGCTAGLWFVSEAFDVPVAFANSIPVHTPLRRGGLYLPKKMWHKKKKRFLTFSEMFKVEYDMEVRIRKKKGNIPALYRPLDYYENLGLELIENSAEEILDFTREMNERIDGTFKITEEDERLQSKLKSLIIPGQVICGTPARMGAAFLRQNKNLLK
ncbi:TIGR04372 family glycosyltransferase [Nanoarchaeota archaeon]